MKKFSQVHYAVAPLRTIPRKLNRLARAEPARRGLLVEAVFWLLLARLALLAIPFPLLARRFGRFVPPQNSGTRALSQTGQIEAAEKVGWAVTRAANHVPFRAVCLPQAIAAKAMLSRRGVKSVLHFGAAKGDEEKPLATHAWLDAAGVEVTGYPVAHQFVEIGCFV